MDNFQEMFSKLDKALALLTQEVGYIRKSIDNFVEDHNTQLNQVQKILDNHKERILKLEKWQVWLMAICAGIGGTMGVFLPWVWKLIQFKLS